jgi:catechol 2,3-dioxygenase-like lactoylglutathione lyase family enzyme
LTWLPHAGKADAGPKEQELPGPLDAVDWGCTVEQAEMGISLLKLLVLRTPQLNRLRRFYQLLGIDFAEERHGTGPTHFAGRVGDAVLELYPLPNEGGTVDSMVRLGFSVTDLSEAIRSLEADGATILSGPRPTAWGNRAVVRDPDGRSVKLYEG